MTTEVATVIRETWGYSGRRQSSCLPCFSKDLRHDRESLGWSFEYAEDKYELGRASASQALRCVRHGQAAWSGPRSAAPGRDPCVGAKTSGRNPMQEPAASERASFHQWPGAVRNRLEVNAGHSVSEVQKGGWLHSLLLRGNAEPR